MTVKYKDDLVTAWRRAAVAPKALRPPIFFDTETPLGQDPLDWPRDQWALLINNYERSEAKWNQLNDLFPPDPKTGQKHQPGATGGNRVAAELLDRYFRMQNPPYPRGTLLPLRLQGMDVMAVAVGGGVSHRGKPHAWEFWFPKTGQHPPEVFSRKMKKFFMGMDCTVCNENDIEWLSRTNVDWFGVYLGATKTGAHKDASWMKHLKTLRDKNLGVAPIYYGHQEKPGAGIPVGEEPEKKGDECAADAVNLANRFRNNDPQKRLSPRAVIYLDIEGPVGSESRQKKMAAYYKAWAKGVVDGGFWPGVYCSPIDAHWFKDAVIETVVWVANFRDGPKFNSTYPFPVKDPAGGESVMGKIFFPGSAISIRQWGGDRRIPAIPPLQIPKYDLDGSVMEDPSDSGLALALLKGQGFDIKWA